MIEITIDLSDVEGQKPINDLRNTQPYRQPKTNLPRAINNVHAAVAATVVNPPGPSPVINSNNHNCNIESMNFGYHEENCFLAMFSPRKHI
ncbi:hypothetical protein C1H46_008380 [Malus baccata]|uniref:Uncharacterized protein n=1 Tax=Malus baccata TaxID=106549 RepID=A0A540N6E6_MALBA|nr:hypothetical protein C1H46_008380 [Malus baccata]